MAAIGFLGTGLMGRPMAGRLIAQGHEVHVWNRSPEKTETLGRNGAIVAQTAKQVALSCDLIALGLTDAAAVEQVLFGPQGVVEAGRASQIIDFTSMAPHQSMAIAARLRDACGGSYLDAPVSGGVQGAKDGTLVVMCGGTEEDLICFAPLLEAVAARVTPMGSIGAGQLTKLCNQHIVASSVIAMAEAVTMARTAGVDVARLPEALAGSFADSKAFRLWGARMAANDWTPNVGALDTMWKDVRNIVATMTQLDLQLPLAGAVEQIYAGLSKDGRGEDDLGSIASYFSRPRSNRRQKNRVPDRKGSKTAASPSLERHPPQSKPHGQGNGPVPIPPERNQNRPIP